MKSKVFSASQHSDILNMQKLNSNTKKHLNFVV